MEMTHDRMVFCTNYLADDSRHNRLISLELFAQEIHDELFRDQLNRTGSLKLKDDDAEEVEEYATSCEYRTIDVWVSEFGNIVANVKDLGITINI